MSIEENKAILRRYVEELCAGNFDVAEEIIHPNMRHRSGQPMQPNGPEFVKQGIQKYHKEFSNLHRTIVDMVAEGDKVVLYSTLSGKHTEERAGLAPVSE